MYRQVRDDGIADIAADFEPPGGQRSDQLGRRGHGQWGYARRFIVTRPPSLGLCATPWKYGFSSAAVAVWIQKLRSTVRSTTSISVIAKSAPIHRRAPPPNASHAGAAGLVPRKRCGSNRSGQGKISGFS